jgi:hypothetical protein
MDRNVIVNVLRGDGYVSLESALRDYGISTRSPHTLTCMTTEHPDEFRSRTITISYRSISPRLYWGFVRKTTRYGSYLIAEPEKTILDWICLGIRNGTEPALDELDFTNANKPKVLEYARRFSSSVYPHVLPALVERLAVGAGVGTRDFTAILPWGIRPGHTLAEACAARRSREYRMAGRRDRRSPLSCPRPPTVPKGYQIPANIPVSPVPNPV